MSIFELASIVGAKNIPSFSKDYIYRVRAWLPKLPLPVSAQPVTLESIPHINRYAPASVARQSPEELRTECTESDLTIECEVIEDAGITVITRKD